MGFYDARGFDPGSEDILLSGLVVGGPDSIQAVQVAGDSNTQGTMDQALGCSGLAGPPPLRAQSPPGPLMGHCGKDGTTLSEARWGRGMGVATKDGEDLMSWLLIQTTRGSAHSARYT